MSAYAQNMRRHDHDAFVTLVEKQRELHRQLEVVAQDLLTLGGNMHDHAAGFRHVPKTCATCAALEATATQIIKRRRRRSSSRSPSA